jgi:hypothetical protein
MRLSKAVAALVVTKVPLHWNATRYLPGELKTMLPPPLVNPIPLLSNCVQLRIVSALAGAVPGEAPCP